MTDNEALDSVIQAFRSCLRPQHFTNYEHCEECAEHDETLRSKNIETLTIEDVGNAGLDPMCFVSPQGFVYYLPALAHLCLGEPTSNNGWYANIFFWHLISVGPGNKRYEICTPEQRHCVVAFIEHVVESRAQLLEEYAASDDALRAQQIWSGHAAV